MLGKNPATAYAEGAKSGYGTARKGEQSTRTHWSRALQLNLGTSGTFPASGFMAEMKVQGLLNKLSKNTLQMSCYY